MLRFLRWLLGAAPLVLMAQSAKTPVLSTITGNVFQADGKPASGASVWWETATGISRRGTVEADKHGHFEFHLPPSSFHICAAPGNDRSANLVPTATCFRSTPIGDRFAADIVVTRPGESVGPLRISLGQERVYSVEGKVVAKVPVTPGWEIWGWAIADRPTVQISTLLPDRDSYNVSVNPKTGSFVIRGLPAGDYIVYIKMGLPERCDTCGTPPRFSCLIRTRVDHDVKGITATIYPNTSVNGRLVGETLPQRQQISLDSGVSYPFFPTPLGIVDASGRFHIDDLPPGDYTVHMAREYQYFVTVRHNGKEAPGNLIRIEPGTTPDLEITVRKATAAILVKVEGNFRSWPSIPLSVLAIPQDRWDDPGDDPWDDPWDHPHGWIFIGVPESGSATLPVGRPGRYLVLATQILGSETEFLRDEVRRHEKQMVSVVARDGVVETVTLRPVVLDMTDIGNQPGTPR